MKTDKIIVFTESASPRLEYIFKFILEQILGAELFISDNEQHFQSFEGPVLNYSNRHLNGCVQIKPHGILNEVSIQKQDFDLVFFDRLFDSTDDFPQQFTAAQDPFGFSFYLLSRYEEYLPFTPDKYGRFEADESVLYKNQWLDKPVIDLWSEKLKNFLEDRGFRGRPAGRYRFINTIDIDQAFAYKHKGIKRTIGGTLAQLLKGNLKGIRQRAKVILGQTNDPFDQFSFLEKIRETYSLEQIYFFLMGDYGPFDKNIHHQSPGLKAVVRRLIINSAIGIHPSFASHAKKSLGAELQRLEHISGVKITKSRQHFLKMHLPDTYLRLIEAGITEDYTMGFAAAPGFRAGTCQCFYWYDLKNEKTTSLRVFPVSIMEGTLASYLRVDVKKAILYYEKLIQHCKKYKGCFISIFHNETVSESGEWEGWSRVYEEMIKKASS